MTNSPYRAGVIHGRFQPFHNGHLSYLVEALELTQTLWVAITNPFGASRHELSDSHRHHRASNPFGFDQRAQMITETIKQSSQLAARNIQITPFDLTNKRADSWKYFVPLDVVQIVTPNEPWDLEKANRFQKAGYEVHLLETNQSTRITATRVRALWRAADEQWRSLVPLGTQGVVDQHVRDTTQMEKHGTD